MTMRMYADRKSLPLERVTVTLTHSRIHAEDCVECETKAGMLDQIDRAIAMEGELDAEQRARLMDIADKCPVHRTLTSEVRIVTRAADDAEAVADQDRRSFAVLPQIVGGAHEIGDVR